jgi:hypothetical protein
MNYKKIAREIIFVRHISVTVRIILSGEARLAKGQLSLEDSQRAERRGGSRRLALSKQKG